MRGDPKGREGRKGRGGNCGLCRPLWKGALGDAQALSVSLRAVDTFVEMSRLAASSSTFRYSPALEMDLWPRCCRSQGNVVHRVDQTEPKGIQRRELMFRLLQCFADLGEKRPEGKEVLSGLRRPLLGRQRVKLLFRESETCPPLAEACEPDAVYAPEISVQEKKMLRDPAESARPKSRPLVLLVLERDACTEHNSLDVSGINTGPNFRDCFQKMREYGAATQPG